MKQEKTNIYDPKKDPEFQKPYIDIDEWREGEVCYRYIHGGFEGTQTRFSLYFPKQQDYKGRFFQFMSPVQGHEDASQGRRGAENRIAFAIKNGAYFVESNMGGVPIGYKDSTIIYRASAAVAEYSREIAAKLYGEHRPYGYIYGGSGGGYKTISCFENTNTWDGAVPYVIGTPVSIPYSFTVRAHAMRLLRNKIPQILDALEPGGSGDIYAGLNDEERAALEEITKFGFPLYAWFAYDSMGAGALPVLIPAIDVADPGYYKDFWEVPGYLGADPNGSAVRDRLQFKTCVTDVNIPYVKGVSSDGDFTGVDDAWQRILGNVGLSSKPWIQLKDVPGEDAYLDGTKIIVQSGEAAGQRLSLERLEGNTAIISVGYDFENTLKILGQIRPGDIVMLDNSDYIAVQTYHRHQVPDAEFKVWDQFRDENGKPIYPQRPFLLGPSIVRGGCGSLQSGRYNGKMIVVAALADESALPWMADWYRSKVKEYFGEKESDYFRLWYIEHALHGDSAKPVNELYFVEYLGAVHQALLDLSDWVERGIAPPDSTVYSVVDGQVIVPSKADERKGIQPVVDLKVNGSKCVKVKVGQPVHFRAEIEVPANAGKLTGAEWSFEGEADYPVKETLTNVSSDGSFALIEREYTFSSPGTYFPVLRVRANRHGDPEDIFTQVRNLCRVRVIVEQ